MPVAPGAGSPENLPDDPVLTRVELALAQLLRRAERTGETARRRSGLHDLDRSGYLLLHALGDGGPRHVNALADILGIDASTATRQIVALEKAGRVERSRDPHDRRAVIVTATDAGRAALAARRADRYDLYDTVLEGWGPDDREQLADLLERLNADLEEYKRTTT